MHNYLEHFIMAFLTEIIVLNYVSFCQSMQMSMLGDTHSFVALVGVEAELGNKTGR